MSLELAGNASRESTAKHSFPRKPGAISGSQPFIPVERVCALDAPVAHENAGLFDDKPNAIIGTLFVE